MFPPQRNSLFLSNLLQREPSCFLVKFCSTDSPTDPALSSCQVQNTHTDRPWSTKPCLPKHEVKKENNHPPSLPLPPSLCKTTEHLIELIKWLIGYHDGQWSRVTTVLWRGNVDLLTYVHKALQLAKQIIQLVVT